MLWGHSIEQSLKLYLQNNEKLEKYTRDDNKKFQSLIESLNVKYTYIENPTDNPPLFSFIYEKSLYELNEKMINQVAYVKGNPEREITESLKIAHLTTLKTTYASKLVEYIGQNINEYIENVFLKIETNTQESEDVVIELLNNEDIKKENKIKIIQKEVVKIQDISKLKDKEIWEHVLEANKVVPKWDNLLYYYQEVNELNKTLIDFFNKEENYSELSKNKMNNEANFTRKILEKFSEVILLSNKISDTSYDFIVKGIWFVWSNLKINNLSAKKVNALLENKKLKLTQDNINSLREFFLEKVIILIESFKNEFLSNFNDFKLVLSDYQQIMNSQKFTVEQKAIIFEKIDIALYEDKNWVASVIYFYWTYPNKIADNLFNILFSKSSDDYSLMVLIVQIPYLTLEDITNYLKMFAEPYCKLSEKGAKSIELDADELNIKLIEALENRNYISSSSFKKGNIIVNRKRT